MQNIQQNLALSQIKIAEEDYKQERRFQRQISYLQQKSFLAEEERERKKAQCDLLSLWRRRLRQECIH